MDCEDLISRLDMAKPSGGDQWIARCPAHADKTPSLSIGKGDDGRILLHCHAGCSADDVVDALGLSMFDLLPDDQQRGLSVSHSKHDASSQGLARVEPIAPAVVKKLHRQLCDKHREYLKLERMLTDQVIDQYQLGYEERSGDRRLAIPIADEKGIYRDVRRWLPPEQRSSNSRKILHWNSGYGAVRLYPIDQLRSSELVLCEGELDALALVSNGFSAITATGGASAWPHELSAAFRGKSVTILLDNDEAGRRGADKRADSLSKHGVKVEIAQWPK